MDFGSAEGFGTTVTNGKIVCWFMIDMIQFPHREIQIMCLITLNNIPDKNSSIQIETIYVWRAL